VLFTEAGHCEGASTSNSCDDDEIGLPEKMNKLNSCESKCKQKEI
jgi:hypothetical protein